MRVYIGGISTETNSFSPHPMTCETFRQAFWYVGEEMAQVKGTSKETCGVYEYLEGQPDVEIVPGFLAHGQTSGMVRKEDFAQMKALLLKTLEQALPVDAVVLNMHGAMQAENCFDCEGELFAAVRALVGPHVPVTSSLDLHACMTRQMADNLDGVSAFRTYPHVDHADAGYRVAEAAVSLARTGNHPQKLYKTLPMIMAVENCCTESGPIVEIMERMNRLLARPEVLSGALNLTQPWLDVPDLGCQVTVFLQPGADPGPVESEMDNILRELWERRSLFYIKVPSIEEALSQSKRLKPPVCVVELGDIVSAGAPGESTVGLRALLEDPSLRPACVTVRDPESSALARVLGTGAVGNFMIGGGEAPYHKRTPLRAKVLQLNSSRVMPEGDVERGVAFDLGTRALLKTEDGLYVIICENSCTNHDPAMMRSMGLHPEEMKIILQKTHQMFKAGYRDIMGSFVYADTPGCTDRNLSRLPFQHVRRPLFPLDMNMTWSPEGEGWKR